MGRSLFERTILNKPVVIYCKRDGTACAPEDLCPHRQVPLSMGHPIDGEVECAYHGLKFNCAGACVENHYGEGMIPRAAQVVTYPIKERYGLLWIWMGHAAKADPSLIADFNCMTTERRAKVHGTQYKADTIACGTAAKGHAYLCLRRGGVQ
ncbi:Rieske 2Fe-2S domain-containing protein [Labrys sp. KB_33_2]|uniref:Rieske 2Fe-2S domain-containing protein n=1 Tax=Labrys sp. KB_33_2 TaxID=3237479 RepID=UPI003F8FDD5C